MKKINLTWFKAAGIRAVKTMAQTALGMMTIGAAINDINWKQVLSVAIVAAVYSMLTSLAGLPETSTDGTLQLDTDGKIPAMQLNFDDTIANLPNRSTVTFKVDPNAKLEQPVSVSTTDPVNVPATDIPINPDPQNRSSQK